MKIAFLGIRGIPARYGGFETFVEHLSVELAARGYEVTVYNRRSVSYRAGEFKGVRLVRTPTVFRKHLETFLHTFLSVCHALFVRYDIVFFCGLGNSSFLFLPRLLGSRVVINVDGLDWEREKWGWFARRYLRMCARFALMFADAVITDSRAVEAYYRLRYGRSILSIPYGIKRAEKSRGEDVLKKYGLERDRYILFVSRLVPENGAHLLIDAYKGLRTSLKLVIAGGATYSDGYIRSLHAQGGPDVVFTGFVFEEAYRQLMSHAYVFVLPSVVSGTRMVLLEAMSLGNCVLVNECPSNMEVIADAGVSCSGPDVVASLRERLGFLEHSPAVVASYRQKALERVRISYAWKDMVAAYETVFDRWKK